MLVNTLFTNYYFEILSNQVIACYDEISASNAVVE
jgi:hypothetical protein